MKKCIKCQIEKDVSEFNRMKKSSDGKHPYCRSCRNAYNRNRRSKTKEDDNRKIREKRIKNPEWREVINKKKRDYYANTEKNNPDFIKREKERNLKTKKKRDLLYKNAYPEKVSAGKFVWNNGLTKKGFECHHWSYNKEHWLDIIHMTTPEHNNIHRFLTYHQESKFYKTLDGELLDTKEKHLTYIKIL